MTYKWTSNTREVESHYDTGTHEGVRAGAEIQLRDATSRVPVDQGELRDSGQVVTDGDSAAVTYTAGHAVIVHERMDLHHPNGQAKYLEAAMDSTRAEVLQAVAAAVRRHS